MIKSEARSFCEISEVESKTKTEVNEQNYIVNSNLIKEE